MLFQTFKNPQSSITHSLTLSKSTSYSKITHSHPPLENPRLHLACLFCVSPLLGIVPSTMLSFSRFGDHQIERFLAQTHMETVGTVGVRMIGDVKDEEEFSDLLLIEEQILRHTESAMEENCGNAKHESKDEDGADDDEDNKPRKYN